MNRYLLSIDQGTTGSTALVMGMDGRTLGRESEELPQHYPAPAWVEHDPTEIRATVTKAVTGALRVSQARRSQPSASRISAKPRSSGTKSAVGRLIEHSSGRIDEPRTSASDCRAKVTRRRSESAAVWCSTPIFRQAKLLGCSMPTAPAAG